MISSRPRRGHKGAKRLDLSDLKTALMDGRTWLTLGRVFEPDGGEHWHVDTGRSGGKRRVMIEVETIPDGQDLTCRLATKPMWHIPDPGDIVAVAIPSGEVDHCPLIVGILDGGEAPEGIGTEKTIVAPGRPWAIRSELVQLGDSDATEQVVKGTTWWESQNSHLDDAIKACDILQTGCKGPATGLAPGVLALRNAFQRLKIAAGTSGANFLSDVTKTK